ncbi:DsbA family oxidoreductase [Agrococcus sp. SGAir0287]|uniref:DsbA family oxidoreductase n=1 Tax=Agrococcus sp. SGAir0287 TaxID=2070347 RepID=UPI0010CCD33A|nr:DsbA family oxidoreductase [Agrococcus sp. SGAir0287]QCR20658.1 disulfide bond formation protein DsbA [Agrococcus sp. SGAir0287]
MQVEIWSDVACPWCYIGKRRFEEALARFEHRDDVEVTYRSYQLDPTLPEHYDGTEAEYLATRKGVSVEQAEQMFAHVAQQARSVGLSYDFDALVVANSMRAHQILHLAKEYGVQAEVKEALLAAHFEQGRDIGDASLLECVASAEGVPAEAVREELATGSRIPSVQQDTAEARALGIQGVPTVVLDRRYAVSGAQPAEVFLDALTQAYAAQAPLQTVGAPTDGEVCGPDGCA